MLDADNLYQLGRRFYEHMRSYGYELTELPLIEPADLFLIKAGDQIADKLFTFDHRGTQLALRPEFTASAAYRYISLNAPTSSVVRWQFAGYVFKDDPFVRGNSPQQFSIGAELLGMDGVFAETEIISMATFGLKQQNITDVRLTLGHIGLLRSLFAQFGLDSRTEHLLLTYLPDLKHPTRGKTYVADQVEKLLSYGAIGSRVPRQEPASSMEVNQIFNLMLQEAEDGLATGGRTRQDISRRLFQKHQRSIERSQIIDAIEFLANWGQIAGMPDEAFAQIRALMPDSDETSTAALNQWQNLIHLLEQSGITATQINIQADLVRSWDYYSGIIFELTASDGTHLGGGGRYNELAKLLGSQQSVAAVGFAYYVDKIMAFHASSQTREALKCTLIISETTVPIAMHWADQLRARNISVQLLYRDQATRTPDKKLVMQEYGNVEYNGQIYPPELVDALVSDLKQTEK